MGVAEETKSMTSCTVASIRNNSALVLKTKSRRSMVPIILPPHKHTQGWTNSLTSDVMLIFQPVKPISIQNPPAVDDTDFCYSCVRKAVSSDVTRLIIVFLDARFNLTLACRPISDRYPIVTVRPHKPYRPTTQRAAG